MKLYQPQVFYEDDRGSIQVYTNNKLYQSCEEAEEAMDDLIYECLENMDIDKAESYHIAELEVDMKWHEV